jgi:hypothetical protein
MNTYREQRTITVAQLRPGDTVILLEGNRTVAGIDWMQPGDGPLGRRRVSISWTDGNRSEWLAGASVEIIR